MMLVAVNGYRKPSKEAMMTRCDGCDKWLDLQSDAVAMDEGTLCVECATEWYGETITTEVGGTMPADFGPAAEVTLVGYD